jgi:hypothetical protein
MRFIISLVLIFGFCLLLLAGLLSVLQDLFARSVHPQPTLPECDSARRQCGDGFSEGQTAA